MPPTLLIAPESSRDHRTPHGHPERVERFEAVLRALGSSGLAGRMQSGDCEEASFDTLRLCHRADYIELVEREIGAGNRMLSTGDTHVGNGSLSAARMAVGAVCSAVDSVLTGPVKQAFCALRPPGHHARPQQGMGLWILTKVQIRSSNGISRDGLQRVLSVDWDVHHGNGTQDIFYEDPSVLFFSTHQSPWYPGTGMRDETGEGAGADTTINCPFPAHTGREEIFAGAPVARFLPIRRELAGAPAMGAALAHVRHRRGGGEGFALHDQVPQQYNLTVGDQTHFFLPGKPVCSYQ